MAPVAGECRGTESSEYLDRTSSISAPRRGLALYVGSYIYLGGLSVLNWQAHNSRAETHRPVETVDSSQYYDVWDREGSSPKPNRLSA